MKWDFGGWFGSLLGSTLWMLILGLTILVSHPLTAASVLVLCALANTVGVLLWNRRDRMRVHPAMQILVWFTGCTSVAVLFTVEKTAKIPGFGMGEVEAATKWSLIVLAMTIGLSLLFWRQSRSRTEERTASS